MKKKLLSFIFILALTGTFVYLNAQVVYTGTEKLKVLMFVNAAIPVLDGDSATASGDSKLYDFLSADPNIELTVSSTNLTGTEGDLYDVVYISTTIGSNKAIPLKDKPVGIVCSESYAFKPGALAVLEEGKFHNLAGVTNAVIETSKDSPFDNLTLVSDKYRLSAGLTEGSVKVYNSLEFGSSGDAAVWYDLDAVTASGGFAIATFPAMNYIPAGTTEAIDLGPDTCVAIFAIDKDTPLAAIANGGVERNAADKIVGFFFHDNTPAISTDEAFLLLTASIYWAGDALDQNVGIGKSFSNKQIKAYPNPVSEVLNLELPSGIYDISIYNTSGKLVKKVNAVSDSYQLSVEGMNTGVYFLKALNGNEVRSLKFIKK
jgi:hypothetical protein